MAAGKASMDPSHLESSQNFQQTWKEENWEGKKLSQAAEDRALKENELSPAQCIKAYPMGIFWCLMVSMCVIMEGYDTILIGNFYAFPTFQRKYGDFVGVSDTTRSGYQLSPQWMAALGNAAGVGAFIGIQPSQELCCSTDTSQVPFSTAILSPSSARRES